MRNASKLLLLSALFSGIASAATDGAPSASETTATSDVSVSIDSIISITHVDDIDFGTFTPNVNLEREDVFTQKEGICVYTNAEGFSLQLDSKYSDPSLSSHFLMEGGDSFDKLTYIVNINKAVESSQGTHELTRSHTEIMPGQVLTGFTYDTSLYGDADCNSLEYLQPNIEIELNLYGFEMLRVTPDSYTDTLTILARTEYGTGFEENL